jgi:hypothetical protein
MIPGMIKCSAVELRQSKSDGKWSDFTNFNAGDGDFAKYQKRRGSSFFISHIHRA